MTTPGTTESHAPALVILGGPCGLAWAAGLRGFMAQITDVSSVSWSGTFGYVLLPGIVIGVLLGWAEHLRRTGGRRGWRWLALSPLPSFQRRLARSARHLRGWDRRRCAGRSALRRGWRLCLLSAWASVGSVTGRCARPDGHPDLGIDGGIFRRARACSGQRTRTLSRPLLLLVHRRVQCRCLHSPSRAGERRPHTIGESGVAARCGRNRGIGLLCSATRVSTTLPEGLHLLWSSPVPDRWGPLASWVRSAEPEVLARPARPAPLAQAGELPPDLCFTGGPKL